MPSTQALVKQRLGTGEDVDGLVVRAVEQPAGQGRRGKAWASPPGGSYQTLAVRDRWDGALRASTLTLRIALCVAEELRAAGARTTVKWPNDVYLGEGKLAGVLCEYSRDHLVVGVGVNVNNPVPYGASSLTGWQLQFVSQLVLESVGRAVQEHLTDAGRQATAALSTAETEAGERGVGGGPLPARFMALDHLLGRAVTMRVSGGSVGTAQEGSPTTVIVRGVAAGIDDSGALLLSVPQAGNDGHERPAAGPEAPATSILAISEGSVLSWS